LADTKLLLDTRYTGGKNSRTNVNTEREEADFKCDEELLADGPIERVLIKSSA